MSAIAGIVLIAIVWMIGGLAGNSAREIPRLLVGVIFMLAAILVALVIGLRLGSG